MVGSRLVRFGKVTSLDWLEQMIYLARGRTSTVSIK